MLEFFKFHYDPGPGHDGESCILCGACADMLIDEDPEMLAEYGEVIEWSSYFPRYDLPEDIYCDHCDTCMEEFDEDDDKMSDTSDSQPCGYSCGDEPHGCLECEENPRVNMNGSSLCEPYRPEIMFPNFLSHDEIFLLEESNG